MEDRDPLADPDSVSEHGMDKNGRRTELGVTAFVREELNGRQVVVFSGHVGIFGAIFAEPRLHSAH